MEINWQFNMFLFAIIYITKTCLARARSLVESYGVVQTVEHYMCAVDLVGRARRVREAEK